MGIAKDQRAAGRLKLAGLALLIVLIAATCPLSVAQEPPAEPSAPAQEVSQVDLSSPKATLFTFLEAMNAVRAGKEERWPDALSAIYLEDISPEEREQHGQELAQQLFEIFDAITIDPNVFSESPEGRELHVDLGDEGQVPLDFRLNDDGAWRFSRSRLEAQVEKVHEEVVEAQPEAPAAGVNLLLSDPRATMRTFINAFNHWDDGGLEEAALTFDLSAMDIGTDAVMLETGEQLAVQLKQIVDRDRLIVFQLIPNDPEGSPYVHLRNRSDVTGQSLIEIVPIPLGEGVEGFEWKFSTRTVAAIPKLWDHYKDLPPVAGVNADTPRLLSLEILTWVAVNTPYLLNDPFILQNWQWLGLMLIIGIGLLVSRVAAYLLLAGIRRYFQREQFKLDRRLEKGFVRPIRIALMAWVWFIALRPLGLPPNVLELLRGIVATISAMAAVWAVYRLIDIFGKYLSEKAKETENKYDDLVVPLVMRTLKIFVVAFGILFVANVNGRDLTAVLAGLGIGGLAFALAAQDTLGNVFGSLTVLMDRPFQIGDWVRIGDVDGNVESVGIRSTRIRTFYNSVVTVPNSHLTKAVVDNYGQRQYRRTKTMIGVTYDTPPEKIDAFCEGIRELIRTHPYTRKDYFHVYLNEFGPSSLNILLYCFHECPDWGTELRERHRLYVDITRLAAKLGVKFAFPTSTLHVFKESPTGLDPAQSLAHADAGRRGRLEARGIVEEFHGPEGTVPPPVSYQSRQHGPDDES